MSLESLLYTALESEFGLIVTSPEMDRLIRKLYPVRKSQPIYEGLSFVRMTVDEMWIVKNDSVHND